MKQFRVILAILAVTFGAVGCEYIEYQRPTGTTAAQSTEINYLRGQIRDLQAQKDTVSQASPDDPRIGEMERRLADLQREYDELAAAEPETTPAPPPPVAVPGPEGPVAASGPEATPTPPPIIRGAPVVSPTPVPVVSGPPVVPGWLSCADAYQKLADAVEGLGLPVATYYQTAGPINHAANTMPCWPVNTTAALRRAAFRSLADDPAGNNLQKCWVSDRSDPGWPGACPHPQAIAADISATEQRLDYLGWTDEGAVGTTHRLSPELAVLGFNVSGIPYFLVQAAPASLLLSSSAAASIQFLRIHTSSAQTQTVYDNYYKAGAASPQPVICINGDINLIASYCR